MSRREKREFYERLLERKTREGLSYRELSEESGVPRTRLAWWGQKLAKETSVRANAFVELVQAEAPVQGEAGYEIVLANDRRIHVPAGFDDQDLRRLVSVLDVGC